MFLTCSSNLLTRVPNSAKLFLLWPPTPNHGLLASLRRLWFNPSGKERQSDESIAHNRTDEGSVFLLEVTANEAPLQSSKCVQRDGVPEAGIEKRVPTSI